MKINLLLLLLLFWLLAPGSWILVLPLSQSQTIADTIVIDDFEKGLKPAWRVKSFKGNTTYSVVEAKGGRVLKAESRASASGLIYNFSYNVKEYPLLSWRWKIEHTVKNGNAKKKEGDDYAARIYVVFPHVVPLFTKSITYIWANKLPKGSHLPNSFYSKAMMVAVESGNGKAGTWVSEKRDVYKDFKLLFGSDPPEAGGIAIMTDTDNTGESAVAWYDDIKIMAAKKKLE